jgi:hypothetical protein
MKQTRKQGRQRGKERGERCVVPLRVTLWSQEGHCPSCGFQQGWDALRDQPDFARHPTGASRLAKYQHGPESSCFLVRETLSPSPPPALGDQVPALHLGQDFIDSLGGRALFFSSSYFSPRQGRGPLRWRVAMGVEGHGKRDQGVDGRDQRQAKLKFGRSRRMPKILVAAVPILMWASRPLF